MLQLFRTVCRAAWRQLNTPSLPPPPPPPTPTRPPSPPAPLRLQLLSHTSVSPLQLSRSRGRRGANLRNFRRSFGTDLENNLPGPCSGSQKSGSSSSSSGEGFREDSTIDSAASRTSETEPGAVAKVTVEKKMRPFSPALPYQSCETSL